MRNKMRNNSNLAVESSLILTDEGGPSRFSTVRYCNHCGHSMSDTRSFIVEYWRSDETVYFCWCHSCGHRFELAEITKITTMELEEEDEDF